VHSLPAADKRETDEPEGQHEDGSRAGAALSRNVQHVGIVCAVADRGRLVARGRGRCSDQRLAAACGLATYFVLSSKIDNDLPPVAVASAGMTVGAVALLGLGAVGVLPMHASFGAVDLLGRRVSWLVPVLGLSLVAAAIAYVAGIGAARRLGPKLATFVGLTEVIFAVLFAWLLLGELPTGLQLVGGALIVIGIALVHVDEMRPGGEVPLGGGRAEQHSGRPGHPVSYM